MKKDKSYKRYLDYRNKRYGGESDQKFEKESLKDSFDADALDGLDMLSVSDLEDQMTTLNNRILKNKSKRSFNKRILYAAASVIIVFGLGAVYVLSDDIFSDSTNQLSSNDLSTEGVMPIDEKSPSSLSKVSEDDEIVEVKEVVQPIPSEPVVEEKKPIEIVTKEQQDSYHMLDEQPQEILEEEEDILVQAAFVEEESDKSRIKVVANIGLSEASSVGEISDSVQRETMFSAETASSIPQSMSTAKKSVAAESQNILEYDTYESYIVKNTNISHFCDGDLDEVEINVIFDTQGVVKKIDFSKNTCDELKNHIEILMKKNPPTKKDSRKFKIVCRFSN